MWRICRVHKPYMWIRRFSQHVRRNKILVIITVFLSTCIGVMLLHEHKQKYIINVKNRGYIFERREEPLEKYDGLIRRPRQNSEKKTKYIPILIEDEMPLLTLFTSWTDRKDKYVVQNRTVENWISFRPHIRPIIFTNDIKLGDQCLHKNWHVLPLKHTVAEGVPVLKYMYLDAMHHFNSVFYSYANSDILFNEGLIKTLRTVRKFIELNQVSVLITGRRINVDYKLPCNASDWRNITTVSKKGELVKPYSTDYFITTKLYPWEEMDEIIIGRVRIDNWIIQFSQMKNITVIDSTPTILAMHQTTETGNAEGESKNNTYYNDDIVRKVRNISVNVNMGRTDCAEYVTKFTTSELVQLVKQSPQSICYVDNSSNNMCGILHTFLIMCFYCVFIIILCT